MRYSEIATAGAFIALGIVMLVVASQLNPIAHSDFGPSLFPSIVGVGLIALGSIAAFSAVMRAHRGGEVVFRPPLFMVERPVLFFSFLAAPIIYVLLSPVLGFLVLTPFLVGGLVFLASGKPLRAVLTGVLATLAIHVLFYEGLRVTLPWGVLTPYAGVLTWR